MRPKDSKCKKESRMYIEEFTLRYNLHVHIPHKKDSVIQLVESVPI